jgi:preprotein translocase SecE subunit
MARNRQRAKQRQAERRAKRLAEQGNAGAPAEAPEDSRGPTPGVDGPRAAPTPIDDPTTVEPSPAVPPELAVGAPPTDEGRSDTVVEDEPELTDEDEALREIEDWEVADEDAVADRGAGEAGYEVRGRRGREDAEAHRDRPRVIQFLIAVWAELQRVQWPNRQALVTLTGVVLGFVLIAGGYLGLLDAIFSELIQAIL